MLKNEFFVTYACGSNLANNFSIIQAYDEDEASDIAHIVTKGKFAFLYTRQTFAGQVEKYNLTEVPLQPQIMKE